MIICLKYEEFGDEFVATMGAEAINDLGHIRLMK